MNISFHGAAQTVTGSKHLVSLNNGKKLLLDCGLFQGLGKTGDEWNRSFGFVPSEINWLVLSHAHIDHCGLIPKLYNDGFRGRIYCTPGTRDLACILLEDSAQIQKDDTKFINKKRAKLNLPPYEPLYKAEDTKEVMELFTEVQYETWFTIVTGVDILFTDAGHIVGSAAVSLRVVEDNNTTAITFSGDVGRYNDLILKSPQAFPHADYIILESTYGNTLHEDVHNTKEDILNWVNKTCLEKGGKLIIPAFSVGRTQELLYILNELDQEKKLPKINFFVDSPLSREATEVVKSHPENFNNELKNALKTDKDIFDFSGLVYVKTVEESKEINNYQSPCVIISASGMADAGRVKHHIMNNISNERNTILLVGYCEPRSLGGQLMNGNKEVKIFGDMFKVFAEVGSLRSMSAHGDYNDLLQFVSGQDAAKTKKIFLVHGEYKVQQDFSLKLGSKGFDVEIPSMHKQVLLS